MNRPVHVQTHKLLYLLQSDVGEVGVSIVDSQHVLHELFDNVR